MKRALIVPGIVALLVVAVGFRAGLLAALEIGVVAVALIGGSGYAIYRVGKTEAARRAAATQAAARVPVKHCECCDRACLTAAICAPGAEPLVNHEQPRPGEETSAARPGAQRLRTRQ